MGLRPNAIESAAPIVHSHEIILKTAFIACDISITPRESDS
jgi:hypothetical protein